MTISKVISQLNKFKPNSLNDETVVDLVNDIEKAIIDKCGLVEEGNLALVSDKHAELLAPPPHENVYFEYISAKIDYFNGDTDVYSLTSRQFNTTMSDLKKYLVRNGLSKPITAKFTDYI
jgi:hypothetical protein